MDDEQRNDNPFPGGGKIRNPIDRNRKSSGISVVKAYMLQAMGALHRLGSSTRSALVLFAGLFLVIVFFEFLSRAPLRRYMSRNFLNDLLYGLFYRGGLYTLFVYQPFFNSLRPKLAIIDLHLLSRIPSYWSLPIYFLITDLVGYWIHRLQHTRFLWPFHSVHHSQQKLTFVTFYRFHFVEEFIANAAAIIPLLLLGAPAKVWLPISFLQWFLQAIQHSELNWRRWAHSIVPLSGRCSIPSTTRRTRSTSTRTLGWHSASGISCLVPPLKPLIAVGLMG